MRKILLLTAFALSAVLSVSAQIDSREEYVSPYSRGSQTFTINGGLFVPLFFYFPNLADNIVSASGQLTLGGSGSIEWASFISDRLSLGIELGGTFSFTPNNDTHVLIPLTGKVSYVFTAGSFEFPVFFGTGVTVNKIPNQVYFGTIFKPGVAVYWNKNLKWGFGLSAQYWMVPEIYFGDNSENTSLGNFFDISLSARFHF